MLLFQHLQELPKSRGLKHQNPEKDIHRAAPASGAGRDAAKPGRGTAESQAAGGHAGRLLACTERGDRKRAQHRGNQDLRVQKQGQTRGRQCDTLSLVSLHSSQRFLINKGEGDT